MAYEQKMGDIAIFREREKKSERAPDWKGSLVVPEGVKPGDKLEVAVWAKTETMLAGQVQIPRPKGDFRSASTGGASPAPVAGDGRDDPFSDPIPF
jgi:hypothetical protein